MRNRRITSMLVAVLCLAVTGAPGAPPKTEADPRAGLVETAPRDAPSRLAKARSLKCAFGPGSHAEWKDGVLAVETGRFGPAGEQSTIYYDAISASTRKARVVGTAGSGDLDVILDGVGLTLIESVPAGGFTITTVYASYDAKSAFPAVMSKHIDLLGPFPQQYYGSCVVWE